MLYLWYNLFTVGKIIETESDSCAIYYPQRLEAI